jgi:hypothetical protein
MSTVAGERASSDALADDLHVQNALVKHLSADKFDVDFD